MRLIADLFLLIGAMFIFLGALGLIRMPDVYNRIQAGTKAVTLGAMGILIGIGFLYPHWWYKLVVIMGFILLTSPVSSSAIARAFYIAGVRPWHSRNDATLKPQTSSEIKEAEATARAPETARASETARAPKTAALQKETS